MSGSPSGDEVSKRESTKLKLPADIGSTFGGRLLRTTAGLREPDAQKCLWMRPCNESIQLQVRAYFLPLRASRIRQRPAHFCLRRVQRGFGRLLGVSASFSKNTIYDFDFFAQEKKEGETEAFNELVQGVLKFSIREAYGDMPDEPPEGEGTGGQVGSRSC